MEIFSHCLLLARKIKSWYASAMKIEAIEHKLQDGTIVQLRSLENTDAPLAIAYVATMYSSSRFLAREIEEWVITVDEETAWIEKANSDDKRVIIGAMSGGQLIGLCDFAPVASMKRMAHRAQCGLSVAPEFQHKGIGTLLMQTLLQTARQAGYEQMELEVVSLNHKAIDLYKKLNFSKCGTIECGMKYKDGTYGDLDIMMHRLV